MCCVCVPNCIVPYHKHIVAFHFVTLSYPLLQEESQNGWTDKPNNYIDQLPTTKQLESAANGVCNSHPPPLVQKGRRSMKEMDGLCPKTINEKANNLNVNPGTPPSPQTPNEHEAMVRIEPAKVVYECKSSFV